MKKINLKTLWTFILLLGLGFYMQAQSSAVNSNPKISFEKLEHDYGTIHEGDNGDVEFTFKNTGKEPLILTNVHGCCGVSVLDWTKDPVIPNASGSIKLRYHTSRIGGINKVITVNTNDPDNQVVQLRLKGEVQRKMFQ